MPSNTPKYPDNRELTIEYPSPTASVANTSDFVPQSLTLSQVPQLASICAIFRLGGTCDQLLTVYNTY
jgi:hypothetical protein